MLFEKIHISCSFKYLVIQILSLLNSLNPLPHKAFLWCLQLTLNNSKDEAVSYVYMTPFDSIENIVAKGEIARHEQFHLLPQCFPKVPTSNA